MKSEKINQIVLINLTMLLLFAIAFNSSYSNYSITINENLDNSDKNDLEATSLSTSGTYIIFWEANGTIICNEGYIQRIGNIISDDNNGAFIAWSDSRELAVTKEDVYAQKVNTNGNTYFGDGSKVGINPDLNGTIICNALDYQIYMSPGSLEVCSDMMGGAIYVWPDLRIDGDGDIYAQRIDKNGNTLWDDNGTVICNTTDFQNVVRVCSDGANGAIITWVDNRNDTNGDIYAQHIDSNGETQWGDGSTWGVKPDRNGTVICNATDLANLCFISDVVDICSDGANGAIIVWHDKRIDTDGDIYAQHIDSNGDTQWGDGSSWGVKPDRNGTVICNATDIQQSIQICRDGANGAIITWEDNRAETDIYAQRVDSDGITQWGESWWSGPSDLNGTVICNATFDQNVPIICYDGENGAIITWEDYRNVGLGEPDLYAQKINSNGETLWGANDIVISNETKSQSSAKICTDGNGGAIIAWQDYRDDGGDIYAQHIYKNGITLWDANGTVICNEILVQYRPKICSDGNGGAIIAWQDNRLDPDYDIYAQRIGYPLPSRILLAGDDDDDDDDDDTGVVVVVVVIIILACVGGAVVVVIVLIKKGIIDLSKIKGR